jgi:hypothetical protein
MTKFAATAPESWEPLEKPHFKASGAEAHEARQGIYGGDKSPPFQEETFLEKLLDYMARWNST